MVSKYTWYSLYNHLMILKDVDKSHHNKYQLSLW
jgi:hypothetical protein